MNTQLYLQRIGYSGAVEPTAATLRELQLAHLQSVPFENLDIHLNHPIVLDLNALYEKIVVRRRGGFCYELNGLFGWLLESLGYQVSLLSASVTRRDNGFGPEYDHLTLRVRCPADAEPETPWLADVGFGDSFLEPLRLDWSTEQVQGLRAYRIEATGRYYLLWQKDYDGNWEKQYRFTLQPRMYSEFEMMCRYHQTSPDSSFTYKRIVTRATPNGRVTLADSRLIVTRDGIKEEQDIINPEVYHRLLQEHFGLEF